MSSLLQQTVSNSAPLGHKTSYPKVYDSKLLFPVARAAQRRAMGFDASVEFFGHDIWNAYELSYQDAAGKPMRTMLTFIVPSDSTNIAESKSVKLYLNSLNHHRFTSQAQVIDVITKDLSHICDAQVVVQTSLFEPEPENYYNLDELGINITRYQRDISLLKINQQNIIHDQVVTHVFKSHCLVTGQPDWGSVYVAYHGPEINRSSLLAYLISFHDHVGFSENCIEQIYLDLFEQARPSALTVTGKFTRRGGIDINPTRSSKIIKPQNWRMVYQ